MFIEIMIGEMLGPPSAPSHDVYSQEGNRVRGRGHAYSDTPTQDADIPSGSLTRQSTLDSLILPTLTPSKQSTVDYSSWSSILPVQES